MTDGGLKPAKIKQPASSLREHHLIILSGFFKTGCIFFCRKSGAGFPAPPAQLSVIHKVYGETTFVDTVKKAVGETGLPGFPSTVGKSSAGSKAHIFCPN